MKIEHLAVWVNDLENMKHFYTTYFNGQANINEMKQLKSYYPLFKWCQINLHLLKETLTNAYLY
ncbi:hypothetical protein HXA35_05120 [Bacillus sp. A301a_S52]|nr:hypothetical protein [Bacillus sp. A301a_S52]